MECRRGGLKIKDIIGMIEADGWRLARTATIAGKPSTWNVDPKTQPSILKQASLK